MKKIYGILLISIFCIGNANIAGAETPNADVDGNVTKTITIQKTVQTAGIGPVRTGNSAWDKEAALMFLRDIRPEFLQYKTFTLRITEQGQTENDIPEIKPNKQAEKMTVEDALAQLQAEKAKSEVKTEPVQQPAEKPVFASPSEMVPEFVVILNERRSKKEIKTTGMYDTAERRPLLNQFSERAKKNINSTLAAQQEGAVTKELSLGYPGIISVNKNNGVTRAYDETGKLIGEQNRNKFTVTLNNRVYKYYINGEGEALVDFNQKKVGIMEFDEEGYSFTKTAFAFGINKANEVFYAMLY